jgi:hypothetical protein
MHEKNSLSLNYFRSKQVKSLDGSLSVCTDDVDGRRRIPLVLPKEDENEGVFAENERRCLLINILFLYYHVHCSSEWRSHQKSMLFYYHH